jgi:hypothetical protein
MYSGGGNSEDDGKNDCGRNKNNVFELKDLHRRRNCLRKQLAEILLEMEHFADSYNSSTNDEFHYVGCDIIIKEESAHENRLNEICSLERRINAFELRIRKRKCEQSQERSKDGIETGKQDVISK